MEQGIITNLIKNYGGFTVWKTIRDLDVHDPESISSPVMYCKSVIESNENTEDLKELLNELVGDKRLQ